MGCETPAARRVTSLREWRILCGAMKSEHGLTRRGLLASVAGLIVARRAIAQPGAAPIPVRGLNHLHLTVSNLQRSLEFYQRVLGMPLAGMQGVEADWQKPVVPMLAIGSGPEFISFSQGKAAWAAVTGSITSGSAWTASSRTRGQGARESRHQEQRPMRADSTPPVAELKFTNPDNVTVQIQDTLYCGGSGALGQPLRQQGGAHVSWSAANRRADPKSLHDHRRRRPARGRLLPARVRHADAVQPGYRGRLAEEGDPIVASARGRSSSPSLQARMEAASITSALASRSSMPAMP